MAGPIDFIKYGEHYAPEIQHLDFSPKGRLFMRCIHLSVFLSRWWGKDICGI